MRFIRLNGGPVLNGCNMNRCYITRFGCQWLVPPAQSTCEAWATPCWPENRAEPLQGSSFLERIWKVIIFALMLRFQQPWCCTWRGRSLLVWCFPITFPRALGEDSMTSNFCCSEANNQTEGLQQLDGLAKINSSELKYSEVLRSTRLFEKPRQLSDQHG